MDFNLADLFERTVDEFPQREYLVCEGKRRTYAEMEARANRLAHALKGQGIEPGDHVGIYALNSVEWVEALWAIFKIRAVWININYRYVEDELRYIVGNADLKGLIYAREFAPLVASVRDSMPELRGLLCIEDGSGADLAGLDSPDYEDALAANPPDRDFAPRSGDDHYILYTGGTTGMPKGVVWRHRDVLYALGGGIDPHSGERIEKPEDMIAKAGDTPMAFLPIAPLMHGATQWACMGQSFTGNKIVLVARFSPQSVWDLIAQEKVNSMMITGDAMGRPLIEALDQEHRRDLSNFFLLTSSAATFSPSVKDRFFDHFPSLLMIDAIGSSESGNNGMIFVEKGKTDMKGGPRVKKLGATFVLDDAGKPVAAGSGEIGRLARSGDIPIGYYNDPVKTAETFVTYDGIRYAMPGDFARIEADGTITLLGRGSVSINSGGEKIFPEEVEAAVKGHAEVFDCTIVGVPDERWGERVCAVVQPRPDCTPTLESVQEACRQKIAGYKVPREMHFVAEIVRSPSGKPDYRWAKAYALEQRAG
ncbi:MAG: acyl-CoA synthetase [Deltaproteobacteria bacterium]